MSGHLMPKRDLLRRLTLACLLAAWPASAWAEAPRVLPQGQLPNDHRLGNLKSLNDYFPFAPSPNVEAWNKRAEQVRRQVLVAAGLWPMPTKMADHAVVHGRVDRDGYTVEKVFLESYPGFFVTGSLYRPEGEDGSTAGHPFATWALAQRPLSRSRR